MEKIKVNKVEDLLDIKEFVDKYKNELEKGEVNKEIIDNLVSTILDQEYFNHDRYVRYIYEIYDTVFTILNNGDYTIIGYLIRNIVYLKNDDNLETYNLDVLCNEAYDLLKKNYSIYNIFISEKLPDEFKKEHILDLKYYMDLSNEKCLKKKPELIEIINKEIWRYI